MLSNDTYGDNNYEISNGQSIFKLKDIIIYQIEFFDSIKYIKIYIL